MSTRDIHDDHEAHIVVAVPVKIAKQRDVKVNLDEVEVTFTTLQGGVWLRQDGEVKEVKE